MTYEPGSPVLITGASGFAGGHLVEHLTGSHEIIGLARTARRQTCVPAMSESVQGKHQPLQWNIGRVQR